MDKASSQIYETYMTQWIATRRHIPAESILPEENLFLAGYLDSLAVFSFVMDIEEELGVSLDQDDLIRPEALSIRGLSRLIADKVAA
ncbi:MAG: acyl carrier protein [Phycisphaeraceae bacterium]|nr:acyl carrier protein [Phycisphaeraceae bacterium]